MGRKSADFNPNSGSRLKQLRAEQGISQERLGELINYTAPFISQIETGKKPLGFEFAATV